MSASRRLIPSVLVAFATAALCAAAFVALQAIGRGWDLPAYIFGTGVAAQVSVWALLAAGYSALVGLAMRRFGRETWWAYVAAGLLPVVIAAVATWPPPHLIRVRYPEDHRDLPFAMFLGQQQEAWPYYLAPLGKYAFTMFPACVAYFVSGRLRMRSNKSLERSRDR